MSMLNFTRGKRIKRCFIIAACLCTLFLLSLTLFLCTFNLNNYSGWIVEQIERSTGYRISFTAIDYKGGANLQFLIADLSVGRGQETLLEIEKINIEIARLDMWNRQLEIGLVALAGIHLHLKPTLLQEPRGEEKTASQRQDLPWNRIQINRLRISDLNADISDGQQSLLLEQANISSDNLLVIDKRRVVTALSIGNLDLDLAALTIQLADLTTLKLDKLSLSGDFDLPGLQAALAISVKQFAFRAPSLGEIIADNSLLDLQLEQHRVSLRRLSMNIFSGELDLQADALLSFDPFSQPAFSVNRLQVLSLLVKDMRLTIPAFMPVSEDKAQGKGKQTLPIKTLLLQQVNLQNMDIRSEEEQLPLTVKALNATLSDFYLVQNNQFVTAAEKNSQAGEVRLQADYLQWAEKVIEEFEIVVTLPEDKALLLQLQSQITAQ